ncbi:MAG: Bacterial membrane flanked domain protein [Candidatus Bathyarchaeota archaeon BA2]|nr:MAG: Bacterial membrane flanked domain protein [Candidatus Bathyarchaeota archaeon BA2]
MRLEDKEKIIFSVHLHWLYVAIPELALIILGFLIFSFTYFLPSLVLVVFAVTWLLAMLIVFLDWLCINYYLTNLRLIEERGIIWKRIMFIPLDKVQDITCKFGILGRIFSFL